MKRNKIIHLIPSNSIGGVESAAKTSINKNLTNIYSN